MPSLTAQELLNQLAEDAKFQELNNANIKLREERERLLAIDETDLVEDLHQIGFEVNSIYDFVNRSTDYQEALPVLKEHLVKDYHPKILCGIARSLADKCFAKDDELWELLVDAYLNVKSDDLIEVPFDRGYEEALAVALRALATPKRRADLERMVAAKPDAETVDWFTKKLAQKRFAPK